MSNDDKIEGKYEYIKPNALIYVLNEIQEDSVVEALIDDRNDQPYIKGTVLKVNKQTREVDIYITELQKNMTVKFEFTLPMPNIQLLKKIENLTDYYPDLNYMDIFNVFKMRFYEKKYFTQIGQDLLVNLDPYHNKYQLLSQDERLYENEMLDKMREESKKFLRKSKYGDSQKSLYHDEFNNSKMLDQSRNIQLTNRTDQSYDGDKYFDDFFENNENEIFIFRGEMYSNKYILFEKLLSKLLSDKNISNIQIDENEIINTENNHSQEINNINMNTSNINGNKMSQSTESLNIDSKIFICYKVFKYFGCTIETGEESNTNQGSVDEENNYNASNYREEDSPRINYKYLMRVNIQYDKKKKVLGGEFLPILFCEPNINYILTHAIFHSIFNINRIEKLYHELYLQNLHHLKEHSRQGKANNNFAISDDLKEIIKKEFNINVLVKYLSLLNFSEEEIKTILNICVSIMFLSELSFKNSTSNYGNIIVENEDVIHIISDLLKIKEESIKMSLLMNTRDINGEANPKFYKTKECEINKNLLARELYLSIYNWIACKFNLLIKYEEDNNKNIKKTKTEKRKASSIGNEMYNKYKDENEIKDEEKSEDENENEVKNEQAQFPKKKNNIIKEKDNMSNSNNDEDKSRDDLFEDVYDIKNKKVIIESIPHVTSCLISPGFKFQYSEKFGLTTFLSNYINEKLCGLFSSTIYKRKLNEMKEEGLEEYANNIPFSDNTNLIELYEHEAFNLLNTINNFCNDYAPSNLNNEIIPLYTNLNTKFALNEQIKFGSRDSKDIIIYQTEGQAKYDLTQLIFDNYNDVSFEVYKTLLSSTNNILCLIILGLVKEEEILNKKDNLFDEFVMSNGLPRKRTFIINILRSKLVKIFENIDTFDNSQNEDKKKNIITRYKFFLCLKCNNDFYKDVIYPRYFFNQLVYNDLLDLINFYKEQFEQEMTFEYFVHKVFRKVDLRSSEKKPNKNSEINKSTNSLIKINDDKQRTVKIIEILINFKVPKWFQSYDEIDLNANNYVLGNTKIFLQKSFYNFLLYKMQALIEYKRRCILRIISHLKGYFYRKKFSNFIRGIIGVQQYFYKYKEKLRKQMYLKKVIVLQSVFRSHKKRKVIIKMRNSQIMISKNYRRHIQSKFFKQLKKTVKTLIPCIKKFLNLLVIKEHKDLKDFVIKIVHSAFDRLINRKKVENINKINAVCRRMLFVKNHPKLMEKITKTMYSKRIAKSVSIIQQYYRAYKAFKDFHYKKFAVDIIRGYWKMKRSMNYIDELYNSIIPIQRGVRRYLNLKKAYVSAMNNYMDQKYNNYSTNEKKKINHYFRVIQREYLQKEGYILKDKDGELKKANNNIDKINKTNNKSFFQKISFFTEINDIDIYNSTLLVYNNEFWCDKFYKLVKVDKKLFGDNSTFLNIKFAETYTCLLNSKGKIYTFGWNDLGQCNIDTVSTEQKSISSLVFSQIECCNKTPFIMNNKGEISQGFNKYNDFSFDGFTSDHADTIYAWKDNYFFKFYEDKINKYKININIKKNSKIKKIACGKNFIIFISDTGLLYSYGKNTKGQLGLEDYKERTKPTLNELLIKDGERITDISCGYKHVIALGRSGKVFSWGSNSNGQCGLDIVGNFNTPMYIDVRNKIKFISICCGFRASFFMDDQRILYFCGKSGINNGESYFIKNFKNMIGEKETVNNLNNLIKMHDKNHLEINNNDTYNQKKNKKNQRSLSTINLNRNKNVNIVSCLNKNTFPVKLNCSWNDSFSVMYITYADTTNLVKNAYKKELDKKKVKNVLDKLTLNWITDNINVRNVMKDFKDILEYL